MLEEIGSGAFGLVRRAKCKLTSHGDWTVVAVKTVRGIKVHFLIVITIVSIYL